MENFNKFYYRNKGMIYKTLCYYNLSHEEIMQECALAYFSDSKIESLFVSGKENEAFSLFQPALRNNARCYNVFGTAIRNNSSYEQNKYLMERVFSETSDITTIEEQINASLDIELLMSRYGNKHVAVTLDYFEYGVTFTAKKYSLTETNVRVRVHRLVERMRKDFLSRDKVLKIA